MPAEKGPLIARGRTAEVFLRGDSQILKLFLDWCPADWAEHEARLTGAVHEAGLPVPATEGIVEIDGRLGIIFERIEGPSMLGTLTSRPWQLVKLARLLAELHVKMHSCKVSGLPSLREHLESRILNAPMLAEEKKETVLKILKQLPDGNAVCHGDFHPDNIVMSLKGPIIIDWMTATQGNPLADVARTSLLLSLGAPLPGTPRQWLIKAARALFHSIYLRRYLRLQAVSHQQIAGWRLPVAVARLRENIPEEKGRLLALIESSLSP
jgi:uncharacterized protein (TIGR02172 family)